ncbi:MAG: hypothetical protein OEN50_18740, partial [Deltaproteobacteria bacterium]|nr:hypothetical protein [Deltaproteobacteria bacterium]
MNPLLLVAIPLGVVILGMILNRFGLSFAYPPSSQEKDPARKVADERDTYRKFFDLQRTQSRKRQERVGQYGWLIIIAFIGAFIWLYTDTVSKTGLANRIAGLQTLATEEGKQMVLS